MTQHFNDGWYFTEQYSDTLLTSYAGLAAVRLPHTVKEVPLNYFHERAYEMVCGYVRPFFAPESWRGKRVRVTFGAAGHEATVFCNGTELTRHRCGYTAFTVELTEHLRYGQENLLTLRLDTRESLNQPPFGGVIDYLCFGGLYRGVTMEISEQSRIADIFVQADHKGYCTIGVQVEHPEGLWLSGLFLNDRGQLLGRIMGPADRGEFQQFIPHAPVWELERPQVCRLQLRLMTKDMTQVDEKEAAFGFRSVDFRADGLYLNEKRVQLRGLNRHQSWPYLGYAVPDRAQALDADILKFELGCNVVRTSHYPQSQAFVNRCDQIGLLVLTEIPGWQYIGGADWQEVCVENVREMVIQYRNHPSIFLWGVRINESLDCDALYARTNAAAHALDPSRPTGGVRYLQKSGFLEDVYTFNDFLHEGNNPGCRPKADCTPDMTRGYMVTEFGGHMFPTKSFDHEGKRLEHALRHSRVLNDVLAQPDIAGCTGWCMFDYNTHADFGSGDRICYHGVLDPFRNHKLAAAVYAAEGCTRPVLTISSNMDIGDHPGGGIRDIYAFTNADTVELYKGKEFVAAFSGSREFPNLAHGPIRIDTGTDMGWGDKTVRWNFRAMKDGKPVALVSKGPVESLRLRVQADTQVLQEDGSWDMATLRFQAVDQQDNVLPYCNRLVFVQAQGPVEVVGPKYLALSGGMGGTYLRTTGKPGPAKVTLHCQGMAPVTLELEVRV